MSDTVSDNVVLCLTMSLLLFSGGVLHGFLSLRGVDHPVDSRSDAGWVSGWHHLFPAAQVGESSER